MGLSLYSHQIEAIEKLHNGSILCGGVGSGKSRTAIAYYFIKECNGLLPINGDGEYLAPKTPKDLYIITTARKRDTLEWESELPPFLLSTHSDISINGINVTVDSWNNIKKYIGIKDAFFIFDEQRVVGYGTWSKSFIHITKSNKWILLSATPGDTWSDYIPVFIANGFYRNKFDFTQQHIVYDRFSKFPKVNKYINVKKLINYRDYILVNMDFERDTQQLHETISVSYDKNMYRDIAVHRWNVYENCPIENSSQLCYLLRKVVNSDISRIEECKKIIALKQKVIIFYNFDYELELLLNMGKDLCIETRQWNGHKHELIPDTDSWLYLVQYSAGAEGWNCTDTNTIIFYSQNYSYKVMIQSAGRIDRVNTSFRTLYYYHLRSSSPIDLAINRCLKNKKNFNESRFLSRSRQKQ